jgi:hypothetical protein
VRPALFISNKSPAACSGIVFENEFGDANFLTSAPSGLGVRVSFKEQIRRTHHEISINGLRFRALRCDALNAILRASHLNGTEQQGTTSYKPPHERRNRLRRAGSMMLPPKAQLCKTRHCGMKPLSTAAKRCVESKESTDADGGLHERVNSFCQP